MKAKAVKTLVVLTVLALVMGISSIGFSHDDFDQELKEVSGTISLKLPGGYYLKTSSGDEYRLMVGPPWFLEEIGLDLNNRDRVTVKGFDDEHNGIMVTSITKGTKSYDIFDADTLSEYGRHGCYGPRGGGRHGMWGYGRHGDWDKRGNYGKGQNTRGMM
jgi:hypothetical protein